MVFNLIGIDQAETQVVFQLQDKGKGFYEKRKGNNYLNRRKKILLMVKLSFSLAIPGCLLILKKVPNY